MVSGMEKPRESVGLSFASGGGQSPINSLQPGTVDQMKLLVKVWWSVASVLIRARLCYLKREPLLCASKHAYASLNNTHD
jgi:hypothetical protein